MGLRLRDLRPTRRGVVAAAIVTGALLAGTAAPRSLNAVVVPGLVAVVAAVVQLWRAGEPAVERSVPASGFPGERRTVEVEIDATVPCRVVETVGDGLAADDPTAAVGHGGRLTYEVELRRRGAHDLGPATCRVTDSLGLFAAEVATTGTATALVYPPVRSVDGGPLSALTRRDRGGERTSFERLREFSPGDTMRDIHWRASAKRGADEFVVAEYGDRAGGDAEIVTVTGEAAPGGADAMAATVAGVAARLHDAGVTVTVTAAALPPARSPYSATTNSSAPRLALARQWMSRIVSPGENSRSRSKEVRSPPRSRRVSADSGPPSTDRTGG
jgi:uncharacterized protein (DUF58 family)